MGRKILKMLIYDQNVKVKCLDHNVVSISELKVNGP